MRPSKNSRTAFLCTSSSFFAQIRLLNFDPHPQHFVKLFHVQVLLSVRPASTGGIPSVHIYIVFLVEVGTC